MFFAPSFSTKANVFFGLGFSNAPPSQVLHAPIAFGMRPNHWPWPGGPRIQTSIGNGWDAWLYLVIQCYENPKTWKIMMVIQCYSSKNLIMMKQDCPDPRSASRLDPIQVPVIYSLASTPTTWSKLSFQIKQIGNNKTSTNNCRKMILKWDMTIAYHWFTML